MRISTHKKYFNYKKVIYSLITIIILLTIWEIMATIKNEPMIFPHLTQIVKSFIGLFNPQNFKLFFLTLFRIIVSVAISFIIALIIGFLYIWNENTYAFFKPIISLMRSIPLAIISIFLFILLNGVIAPIIITILVVLPIATEGILTAIKNIDQNILDDLKLVNTNIFASLFYVYLPLIKNYLLMVFIQTFGLGVKVMIMGEFICYTKNSIGKELSILKSSLDLSNLIAWGILIVIIVALVESLSKYLIKNKKVKNVENN